MVTIIVLKFILIIITLSINFVVYQPISAPAEELKDKAKIFQAQPKLTLVTLPFTQSIKIFYCLPPLNLQHKLSLQGSSALSFSGDRDHDHDHDHDNADGNDDDAFCGAFRLVSIWDAGRDGDGKKVVKAKN